MVVVVVVVINLREYWVIFYESRFNEDSTFRFIATGGGGGGGGGGGM